MARPERLENARPRPVDFTDAHTLGDARVVFHAPRHVWHAFLVVERAQDTGRRAGAHDDAMAEQVADRRPQARLLVDGLGGEDEPVALGAGGADQPLHRVFDVVLRLPHEHGAEHGGQCLVRLGDGAGHGRLVHQAGELVDDDRVARVLAFRPVGDLIPVLPGVLLPHFRPLPVFDVLDEPVEHACALHVGFATPVAGRDPRAGPVVVGRLVVQVDDAQVVAGGDEGGENRVDAHGLAGTRLAADEHERALPPVDDRILIRLVA